MFFQIRRLILWSKWDHKPREIVFELGKVNIISGASKTGKSAVIPIIDYCLGANKCAIPVGVIRENCSWFGIEVRTVEGALLLARREPGNQKQTSDMFVLQGLEVDVPDIIHEKNSTTTQVKGILNRIAGLSSLGMDPNSEGFAGDRASFRDLMAFTFQPQNVIANPDVLFFKADTTEHREKLKSIFPYVLNAASEETLALKWELERLKKVLRIKETALRDVRESVKVWRTEAESWVKQAVDVGLLGHDVGIPKDWTQLLALLKRVSKSSYRDALPTLSGIEVVLRDLENLREQEREESLTLSICRQRLLEVNRLIESSRSYGSAIEIQRDRLSIAEWILDRTEETQEPLSEITSFGKDYLWQLHDTLEGIEFELRSQSTISDKLDKEQLRLRSLAEQTLAQLNGTRAQIKRLESRSDEVREAVYRSDRVERYLGRLEQALQLYENVGIDSELSSEVENLSIEIGRIKTKVAEHLIKAKVDNALAAVQASTSQIASNLDAEWPEAAVKFVIQDLTVKVVHGTRDDYLWEIGSGANWLAYHVSVSLSFHRFFLESPHHPVPSFIVYDQPSQVYFPRALVRSPDDEADDPDWKDEDVVAVRKIFTAVSEETLRANGRLQVILLDHADESVWGNIDNIHLAEEWRYGAKLVPQSWISPSVP